MEVTRISLSSLPETDLRIQCVDRSVEMPSVIFGGLGDYFQTLVQCDMPDQQNQRILDLSSHPAVFDLLSALDFRFGEVTQHENKENKQQISHNLSSLILIIRCSTRQLIRDTSSVVAMQLAAEMVNWPTVATQLLRDLEDSVPYAATDFQRLHALYSFAKDRKHQKLNDKIIDVFLRGNVSTKTIACFPDGFGNSLLGDLVERIPEHNDNQFTHGRDYERAKRQRVDDGDTDESD
jgi:hypothetical protein